MGIYNNEKVISNLISSSWNSIDRDAESFWFKRECPLALINSCILTSSASFKDHTGRVSMFLRRWPRIKWDKTGPCLLVLGVGLTFFNLKLLLTALEKVDLHCAAPAENNGSPNKTFAVHGKRVRTQPERDRRTIQPIWLSLMSHDYEYTLGRWTVGTCSTF